MAAAASLLFLCPLQWLVQTRTFAGLAPMKVNALHMALVIALVSAGSSPSTSQDMLTASDGPATFAVGQAAGLGQQVSRRELSCAAS